MALWCMSAVWVMLFDGGETIRIETSVYFPASPKGTSRRQREKRESNSSVSEPQGVPRASGRAEESEIILLGRRTANKLIVVFLNILFENDAYDSLCSATEYKHLSNDETVLDTWERGCQC